MRPLSVNLSQSIGCYRHGPENIAAVLDRVRVLAIKMHVMHMPWRTVAQGLQGERFRWVKSRLKVVAVLKMDRRRPMLNSCWLLHQSEPSDIASSDTIQIFNIVRHYLWIDLTEDPMLFHSTETFSSCRAILISIYVYREYLSQTSLLGLCTHKLSPPAHGHSMPFPGHASF